MTREEKIRYVAMTSRHTIDEIRAVADRSEDNLNRMVLIADGEIDKQLDEQVGSLP